MPLILETKTIFISEELEQVCFTAYLHHAAETSNRIEYDQQPEPPEGSISLGIYGPDSGAKQVACLLSINLRKTSVAAAAADAAVFQSSERRSYY